MRAPLVVALVVALGGCFRDPAPPRAPLEPPPAPTTEAPYYSHTRPVLDCKIVIQAIVDKYDRPDSGMRGLAPVLLDVGVTSCREDSWPEDLLVCFNDAADEKEIQGCAERMSQEQKDKLGERLRIALQSTGWPNGNGSGSAAP